MLQLRFRHDRFVNVSAVGEETCRLGGSGTTDTQRPSQNHSSHVPRPRSDRCGKRGRREERGIPDSRALVPLPWSLVVLGMEKGGRSGGVPIVRQRSDAPGRVCRPERRRETAFLHQGPISKHLAGAESGRRHRGSRSAESRNSIDSHSSLGAIAMARPSRLDGGEDESVQRWSMEVMRLLQRNDTLHPRRGQ